MTIAYATRLPLLVLFHDCRLPFSPAQKQASRRHRGPSSPKLNAVAASAQRLALDLSEQPEKLDLHIAAWQQLDEGLRCRHCHLCAGAGIWQQWHSSSPLSSWPCCMLYSAMCCPRPSPCPSPNAQPCQPLYVLRLLVTLLCTLCRCHRPSVAHGLPLLWH